MFKLCQQLDIHKTKNDNWESLNEVEIVDTREELFKEVDLCSKKCSVRQNNIFNDETF